MMTIPENCVGVCFTGHRDLSAEEAAAALEKLDKVLRRLIEKHGAYRFFAGGALGLDTYAALTVLRLKKEYPGIFLDLVLPCADQDRFWPEENRLIYRSVIASADRTMTMAPQYYRGCMFARDRAMVDFADLCIAYLRPGTESGGTLYTVNYARKTGVPVLNLTDPDLDKLFG